jgi:serine/threonine protein kinase
MKDPASLRQIVADLGPEYELVRELGRGTTAVVYLVIDHALGREVALKVIRASYAHGDEALARLQREARLVAQLQHPNIVKLYGTRQFPDGSMVLLMEHVAGRNLKELLREKGRLPVGRAVAIMRDVASALAYAHRRRIVHRDVKPENIYIDDEVGMARLADFGVARPWDRDTRLTLPGESLGTPAYMSPEQIDNAEVDGRSDVYSLGMVGYEMLAGEHPWDGENLYSVIFKQKNEDLPPLSERRPGVPRVLVETLERALHKDPDQRWESADAFLEQLPAGGAGTRADRFAGAMGDDPDDVVESEANAHTAAAARGAAPPSGSRPAEGPASEGPSAPAPPAPPPSRAAPAAAPPTGSVEEPSSGRADSVEPPPARAPATGGGEPADATTERRARSASRPTPQAAPIGPAPPSAADAPEPQGEDEDWEDDPGWDDGGPDPYVPRLPGRAYRKRPGATVPAMLAALLVVGAAGGWYVLQERAEGGAVAAPPPVLSRMDAAAARDSGPGDSLPDPAAGAPDAAAPAAAAEPTLSLAPGLPLEGTVGDALPVGVQVSDQAGTPLAGVTVRFRADGDAELVADSAVTDDAGSARTVLRLPARNGPVVLTAEIDGREADPIRLELRAVAGPPARVVPLLGQGQDGLPGALLTDPLGVRVIDADGNPVAGAEVLFRAAEGGGSLEPQRVRSDTVGRAYTRWRMGTEPGAQRAEAVVPEVPGLAFDFTATVEGPVEPVDPEDTPPPVETATPSASDPSPTVVRHVFAVGGTFACRLAGGARCRGGNDRGQVRGGSAVELVAVAAGVSHACGLDAGGIASCWGANESGQVGDGSRTDRAIAVPVDTPQRFAQLAAGLAHTCALDGAGRAWCWGRNLSGQLGDGNRDDRPVPRPAMGEGRFRRLVAGWNHTCGLDAAGRAWCWGLNADGQLGDRSRLDRLSPARLSGAPAFQALAAGSAHTCGLSGGNVLCWGDNGAGQLGDGTTTDADRPVDVQGLPGAATQISAGAVHTCALLDDGRAFCWGQNLHGQLGVGEAGGSRAEPAEVAGGFRFRSLESGGGMTCGITEDGGELCWGLNQSGQLGDGTRTNRARPVRLGG